MSIAGIQLQSIFEHKPGADTPGVARLKASCLLESTEDAFLAQLLAVRSLNRKQGLPRDLLWPVIAETQRDLLILALSRLGKTRL